MNNKSFMLALGLLAILGVAVAAQDAPAREEHARPTTRPHMDRPERERLSDERINELLEHVKQERPEMYNRLLELRKNHPGAFMRTMIGLDESMREMEDFPPELRESFRRVRADNVRAAALVRQINDAKDPAQKEALRKDLHDVVAQQFDDMQKLKEYKFQQLSRQLENLRRELDERARQRDEIIDGRTKQLLEGRPLRFW